MKIWQVAFESLPFFKVGGLGDMVFGLSQSLKKTEQVSVLLPYHSFSGKLSLSKEREYIVEFQKEEEKVEVYNAFYEGVEYRLFRNEKYFVREEIYGYPDDKERYCFFASAVFRYMEESGEYPHVLHSHDYHIAPLIALCKYGSVYSKAIRQVFTVHNFRFQGFYEKEVIFEMLKLPKSAYDDGTLRYGEGCNFLKIALVLADKITTVSQSYAEELLREINDGVGMVLANRKDSFTGILNGIHTPYFAPPYSLENFHEEKKKAKISFQRNHQLPEKEDVFAIGMVARLSAQKGIEYLLRSKIWETANIQLWIVGKGESHYEDALFSLQEKYPQVVYYQRVAEEELAKEIYKAADLFLMPSLWEPCGLSQMIAMHYGTLPLVRYTGGLKESVTPYPSLLANGFAFKGYCQDDFAACLQDAKRIFETERATYFCLQENAMREDVSFAKAGKEYLRLYGREYEKI